MKVTKTLKKIIPKSLKVGYRREKIRYEVTRDFIYDCSRYLKLSASINMGTKQRLQAFLIKEYHAIEKGLALRDTKVGFGAARISLLIENLRKYILLYGIDSISDTTIACLQEYIVFDQHNNKSENDLVSTIREVICEYENLPVSSNVGGTKVVRRKDVLSAAQVEFHKFFLSRNSVRDFSDVPVSRDDLLDAISTARYTPSVCNRQAWKVFIIDSSRPELKAKFLSVQNGNRGFGDQIDTLLIITGKLASFFAYERNQVFVDGGMFAMSVVLSLHSKGLGTCCLNTSYTSEKHKEFNKISQLDEDLVPIMFIAVGNLKEEYKVAVSERRTLEDFVSFL